MRLISPPGSLAALEHVIIARRPREAAPEGLEDVEVATRQDMEEPVALEEVRPSIIFFCYDFQTSFIYLMVILHSDKTKCVYYSRAFTELTEHCNISV